MKRLTVDSRKVPLMKQEMQSACFPLFEAEEMAFSVQAKEVACFERGILCAEVLWKLEVNASKHVTVTKLC